MFRCAGSWIILGAFPPAEITNSKLLQVAFHDLVNRILFLCYLFWHWWCQTIFCLLPEEGVGEVFTYYISFYCRLVVMLTQILIIIFFKFVWNFIKMVLKPSIFLGTVVVQYSMFLCEVLDSLLMLLLVLSLSFLLLLLSLCLPLYLPFPIPSCGFFLFILFLLYLYNNYCC